MASYAWKNPHPENPVYNCVWVIDAPWAHPLWSQYVVLLYDLTTVQEGVEMPKVVLEGATHEFMVYAVDPDAKIEKDTDAWELGKSGQLRLLQPANYGYQFKAETNEAAEGRIQGLVDQILAQTLSPDTDFRSWWDRILPDMKSLHSSVFSGPAIDAN